MRFLICGSQKDFEKLWRCGIIVLPVTEKFIQIPLQKPIEITDPIQSLGMHDHAEPWIAQKGTTSRSRFSIVTVNRDDGFEIAESLSLQALKSLGDEIGTLIDWQSHSDARCRHMASRSVWVSQQD
jgi:hypothetical protein